MNVFGLPLAVTSNQDSLVSLQFKGCCTSKAKISCCGNDCKCCFSNELPSDDLALVQEKPVRQGVQIVWLDQGFGSSNKAHGMRYRHAGMGRDAGQFLVLGRS